MVAAPVAINGIVYVNEVNGGGTGKAFGFNELSGAVVQSNPLITVDVTSPAVSHSGVYTSGDDLTTYDFAPTIVSAAAPPTFSGDTGQGTVVGVVDTGIDLANPDFQTNSGTRIVDLWDQAACPNAYRHCVSDPAPKLPGIHLRCRVRRRRYQRSHVRAFLVQRHWQR